MKKRIKRKRFKLLFHVLHDFMYHIHFQNTEEIHAQYNCTEYIRLDIQKYTISQRLRKVVEEMQLLGKNSMKEQSMRKKHASKL